MSRNRSIAPAIVSEPPVPAGGPARSYCAQEVRRLDNERYLTCLFAPAKRREHLFALYAFNLELAKTPEMVSEAILGRIRLQWWRENLEEIFDGRPRKHAVIQPLSQAITRHDLPRALFERLIDGREQDFEGEAPESLSALEDYAVATSSGLVSLALKILGVAPEGRAGEAATRAGWHIGVAWALTGLLRAVPFHAGHKRLYLPQDITTDAGLSIADLFELRPSPALATVTERVAARAAEHLALARGFAKSVPRAALPALLPANIAQRHLRVLRKAGFDPFDSKVQRRPSGTAWRLSLAVILGRY